MKRLMQLKKQLDYAKHKKSKETIHKVAKSSDGKQTNEAMGQSTK
jgi:hypothetical protein